MLDETISLPEGPSVEAAAAVARAKASPLAALAEAVSRCRSEPKALLEAARSGDADAYAALVARFEAPVYRFILRLVRRPSVAEDLSQEVFVRLWQHLDRLDDLEQMPGWLRRVAANAVIDHWRKEDARRRRLQTLREHPIARRVVRPSGRMESAEAMDAVRRAVESLPPRLRSVLLLRTQEGLSYEEIADALGISVGAVRSRLFRARQMVLEALRRSRAAEFLERMYAGRRRSGPER